MNETRIFRPRLAFEREFGQHRNWWVRGEALSGNAVKILLALLSHDQAHEINQTAVQKAMGLGQSAWRSAKEDLMRAGFLIEVRDRYPASARRADGSPCGGQKRFRLLLQDPPEGTRVDLADAIIEATQPVLLPGETPEQGHSRKSRVDDRATLDNQEWVKEAPVRATLDNQETAPLPVDNSPATLDNQESLIGREEDWIGLDGITPSHPIPSLSGTAREADRVLDEQLQQIHPSLTVSAIAAQVRGRIDLAGLDLVSACIEILNANKKPGGVTHPAAYVAKSLVADPERWVTRKPYLGLTELEKSINDVPEANSATGCASGLHDWGAHWLPEHERGHCIRDLCGVARRHVDADYAALEAAEFEGRM